MNCASSPIASCSCGSSAVTARLTSTVLAAGSFVIEMVRAGSPFTREIEVTGSWARVTAATSPIVRAPPAACAGEVGTSGRAAISSTLVIFAPVCTVRVWSPSVTDPPGKSTPFWSSASVIAVCVKPAAASFAWSGVIVTRCPRPPTIEAALTPFTSSRSGMALASSCAWIVFSSL